MSMTTTLFILLSKVHCRLGINGPAAKCCRFPKRVEIVVRRLGSTEHAVTVVVKSNSYPLTHGQVCHLAVVLLH